MDPPADRAAKSGDFKRGMGLGLPLSRSIVEVHGGRLDVRNVTPHGCEFSFVLPAVDAASVMGAERRKKACRRGGGRAAAAACGGVVRRGPASGGAGGSAAAACGGRRGTDGGGAWLKDTGYSWWKTTPPCGAWSRRRSTCTAMRCARPRPRRRALLELSSQAPDLAILDLGLPDGGRRGRYPFVEGWSALPVIVLSARLEDADKVAALDAGADDYLVKPFSVEELLARVRVALRRLERERVLQGGPKRPCTRTAHCGSTTLRLRHA